MIAIRDAIPDDYDAYARLFPELGVDDPVTPRERFLGELITRMLIATTDGAIAGYLLYERLATTGYIRNIVTDPAHRRLGVGSALMQAARERFTGPNATGSLASWELNVEHDNTAAIALYQRFGLAPVYRTISSRLSAETMLPAPAPDVTVAPLPSERDGEVEPRMKLLPGQLASARKRGGRFVIALSRRDDVVGLAVMMPHGAFPFRLLDPSLAATFMSLLRPMGKPHAPWLQFAAEDDDALAAELTRLGCLTNAQLLHMRGSL